MHVSHVGGEVQKNILSVLLWAPANVGEQHCLACPERLVASQELSRPSKPGNTDSVSQNFKKLGKHIPGLPRFRVCPPHFLERIVAFAFVPSFENLLYPLTTFDNYCVMQRKVIGIITILYYSFKHTNNF